MELLVELELLSKRLMVELQLELLSELLVQVAVLLVGLVVESDWALPVVS